MSMELLMRLLKVLFLSFFLLTLSLGHAMQPKMHFFDEDSQIIYQVNAQASKILKKRYRLEPMGTGFSAPDDLILEMDLAVRCYANLDIPKARRLVVKAARTYLEIINSNKKLKPFLVEHPFGPKNIAFDIYIAYPGKYGVEIGNLVVAGLIKGRISYNIRKAEYGHKRIHEESFEEAEQIVLKEKQ